MSYRPLPPYLNIETSDIEGHGIFCEISLHEGTELGVSHVKVEGIGMDSDLVRTPLGGYLNHSHNPNCRIICKGRVYVLQAIENIEPGDELTVNYLENECGKNYSEVCV